MWQHIVEFLGIVYEADDRPVARRIMIGCIGVILLVAVAVPAVIALVHWLVTAR